MLLECLIHQLNGKKYEEVRTSIIKTHENTEIEEKEYEKSLEMARGSKASK